MPSCDALSTDRMVAVNGGDFLMGSNDHYPEEAPARRMRPAPFLIDKGPVTNADFQQFVEQTGYVTFAERAPSAADYPDADPALLVAGSAVFTPPAAGPVRLDQPMSWWAWVPGADWRHPQGPESSIAGIEAHPVVHIAHVDAQSYARWADKRLPSEAEWECAARGGLEGMPYAWGTELEPGGAVLANYWRGEFPSRKLAGERFTRTSPVGAFPPNRFGLFDMIGNVWEWTDDWYTDSQTPPRKPCCAPSDARTANDASDKFGRKVLKGGSHLCADNYCQRYRPAARLAQPVDTTTSHVGFRCARSF